MVLRPSRSACCEGCPGWLRRSSTVLHCTACIGVSLWEGSAALGAVSCNQGDALTMVCHGITPAALYRSIAVYCGVAARPWRPEVVGLTLGRRS